MTNEEFSRYDSADYLKTEEDIAAFLQAVIEEDCDDVAFMTHALNVVDRARKRLAPGSNFRG